MVLMLLLLLPIKPLLLLLLFAAVVLPEVCEVVPLPLLLPQFALVLLQQLLCLPLRYAAEHETLDAVWLLLQHLLHHSMPCSTKAAAQATTQWWQQLQVKHLQHQCIHGRHGGASVV